MKSRTISLMTMSSCVKLSYRRCCTALMTFIERSMMARVVPTGTFWPVMSVIFMSVDGADAVALVDDLPEQRGKYGAGLAIMQRGRRTP